MSLLTSSAFIIIIVNSIKLIVLNLFSPAKPIQPSIAYR